MGQLFLTSSYLLWDSSLTNPDLDNQVCLFLKDINAISRQKFAFVMDSIKITTKDGEVVVVFVVKLMDSRQ